MRQYPKFAFLLNEYLEKNSRSGSWLAGELQVHQSTVNRWLSENTRPRNSEIVVEIARILTVQDGEKINELLLAAGYKEISVVDEMTEPSDNTEVDDPAIQTDEANAETNSLLSPTDHDGMDAAASPYMGLHYFDETDADLFFGRDELTAGLAEQVRSNRFLAVVGASGSGKSSVVRAGIVPALKGGGRAADGADVADGTLPSSDSPAWAVHVITPTAHPIKELAATLTQDSLSVQATSVLMDDLLSDARSLDLAAHRLLNQSDATHLLLVVDQFEELFTLCRSADERRAFVENLLTASVLSPDGEVTLIIALRADFYAHCAEFDELRDALTQHQAFIGAMTSDELRLAIEEPAKQNDITIEPGLVDLVLQDVGDEPGALPLLSHALLETWTRREEGMLTLQGYTDSGRISGAIAHTAEAVFNGFSVDEKAAARHIFLQLTELGEGAQDTRRRVKLFELMPNPEMRATVEGVVEKLANARLITVFHHDVEVAHEALIREWPTLRQWLDEDREGLLTHRRLSESAQEWELLAQDAGLLYRGLRLAQTVEWATEHDDKLTVLERDFLDASVAERERVSADRERLQREREEAQAGELKQAQIARNRARIAALASLVTALLLLGIGIYGYREFSQRQQENAANQIIADSLALVDEARVDMENLQAEMAIDKFVAAKELYPELALDLASEVENVKRTVAISRTLQGESLLRSARSADDPEVWESHFISATLLFSQAMAIDPPPDAAAYVRIPAGAFQMGADESDPQARTDEFPNHEVALDEFWIMRTEVTNLHYKRCVDAGICSAPANGRWDKPEFENWPVTDVSWNQSHRYAEWVGGRLPTEAEWEKACKADGGQRYPWGNEAPNESLLNYGDTIGGVIGVGQYLEGTSPYGLFDMAGNAWEWTEDLYAPDYYATSITENPMGPEESATRTLRGGSYWNAESYVRCSGRRYNWPHVGNFNVGFRVVVAQKLRTPLAYFPEENPDRVAGGSEPSSGNGELARNQSALLKPILDDQFVTRQDSQLLLGDEPFRFVGSNAYFLQQEMATNNRDGVIETLDTMASLGLSVARLWAFNNHEPTSDVATIQLEPGVYNEDSLVALDQVVAEAKQRNIRLILTLANNWAAYGGIPRYLEWCDCDASHGDFFTNETMRGWYRDYATMLVNRRNSVTGLLYKDEPAILAWELGHSLRNPDDEESNLLTWQAEMASMLKAMDPNHLIADGGEGFDDDAELYDELSNLYAVRGDEGASYHRLIELSDIDMVSYHLYPGIWGLDNENDADLWIQRHEALAKEGDKVAYLGGFGLKEEDAARSATYERWLSTGLTDSESAGAIVWSVVYSQRADYDRYSIYCPTHAETCQLLRTFTESLASQEVR